MSYLSLTTADREAMLAAIGVAEIEELCVLIGISGSSADARPGAVWIADRIGGVVAVAEVT